VARPKAGYFNDAGTAVPGVTTIIGNRQENVAPLHHWHWELGKQGLNYREEKAKAGYFGTVMHEMLEMFYYGRPVDECLATAQSLPILEVEQAIKAFSGFTKWQENIKIEITASEIQLVSEQFQFGGTPDLIGRLNGKLCLFDWKTSKGFYNQFKDQLAAYRWLWNENNPDTQIEGDCHLLRFSRNGDFAHYCFNDLNQHWERFKLLRQLYTLDKQLRR